MPASVLAPVPATILTDSLSTIVALQSSSTDAKSVQMTQLLVSLDKLATMPTLAWIPGHAGIKGNETADRLAKDGAASNTVEHHTPHELRDEFRLIDLYALHKWQTEYSASTKGDAYRVLEPQVSLKVKYIAASRGKETMITRLRLGKCKLNKYLHEIKAHHDGLCTACKHQPETIAHFLLDCPVSDTASKLRAECAARKLDPTLAVILANPQLQDLIYQMVLDSERRL